MNALEQWQQNDLYFLDHKNRPIGELETTGVDSGETESPHVELTEPDNDLDPISAGAETLS